jgi:homoprotocatechuate degradation regulator HpaR
MPSDAASVHDSAGSAKIVHIEAIVPNRMSEPAVAPLRRNLPLLLLQAREAVMARFRGILNRHGVTEQQWRVLRALLDESPLEPRQICERCQLLSASAAGVLARMEEMGLVQRERMVSDQRRVLVSITPKSRAIARRVAPLAEAQYARLEQAVGSQRLAKVYATLDELLERLATLPAETDGS